MESLPSAECVCVIKLQSVCVRDSQTTVCECNHERARHGKEGRREKFNSTFDSSLSLSLSL